jgi:hypothetical protein
MSPQILILSLGLGVSAMAQHHHGDHAGHAGHSDAPISIMGDHVHPAGELMFSYRYMDMDGMRNGTSDVSSTEVFGTSVAPPPAPRYSDIRFSILDFRGCRYLAARKAL